MSEYEKELAIHDYIVNNVSYYKSGNLKDSTAYGALVKGKTVCAGYAEAADLLLKICGIKSRIIIGETINKYGNFDGTNLHAWNLVKIDGIYYHLDVTWDDIKLDNGEFLNHDFFNISDDNISYTHKWDRDKYIECLYFNDNYYYKNKIMIFSNSSLKKYITAQLNYGNRGCIECLIYGFDISNDVFKTLHQYGDIKCSSYDVEDMYDYSILNIYINT